MTRSRDEIEYRKVVGVVAAILERHAGTTRSPWATACKIPWRELDIIADEIRRVAPSFDPPNMGAAAFKATREAVERAQTRNDAYWRERRETS